MSFLKKGKHKHAEAMEEILPQAAESIPQPNDNLNEVATAIGLALSMYMRDIHDFEQTIITMQKVMRPYSPWSSKIYSIRETPARIPGLRQIIKK